jgi:hypothetical protein
MLAFVHKQTVQERDQTREALEALSRQLELADQAASRFRSSLESRDEAIVELNREANGSELGTNRYAGLFVADSLPVLRLRHGNEISEHLLHEVSHKHLLSSVPSGKIFRWSAQSILAIWCSQKELVEISSAIAASCQTPFDCRAFVGTRTATFRIMMRCIVLNAQSDATGLIRALDDFSKGTDSK